MKRPVKNIFARTKYHCFGCSPHNEIGLHLHFYEDGDYVQSSWKPTPNHEGYPNIVHGGILSTLIDEVAGWTLYVKARCAGVTSRMNIRYRKPASSTQGELLFRGKIKAIKRNLCYIEVELFNSHNEICAEAEVIYFMFSREKSINEYYYPEDDSAFFDE